MVPGGRPLIVIFYQYNARKFFSFIFTYNAEIVKAGLTNLSKYPNQFSNVAILSVAFPLAVYKLFGSVNEVYSHNKSRQSYLVLYKLWVTRCGFLWLSTIISMGITIKKC